MKVRIIGIFTLTFLLTNNSYALNTDEWKYSSITGNLKPTAGCKSKEKASKQASTGYRFNKYTTELCNSKGYGWGKDKVEDNGELICEACEGEFESSDKYRCYMRNVSVRCKQVKAGW